jgi:hypothetical protein
MTCPPACGEESIGASGRHQHPGQTTAQTPRGRRRRLLGRRVSGSEPAGPTRAAHATAATAQRRPQDDLRNECIAERDPESRHATLSRSRTQPLARGRASSAFPPGPSLAGRPASGEGFDISVYAAGLAGLHGGGSSCGFAAPLRSLRPLRCARRAFAPAGSRAVGRSHCLAGLQVHERRRDGSWWGSGRAALRRGRLLGLKGGRSHSPAMLLRGRRRRRCRGLGTGSALAGSVRGLTLRLPPQLIDELAERPRSGAGRLGGLLLRGRRWPRERPDQELDDVDRNSSQDDRELDQVLPVVAHGGVSVRRSARGCSGRSGCFPRARRGCSSCACRPAGSGSCNSRECRGSRCETPRRWPWGSPIPRG